jgi:hypothetical protein
MEHQPSKIAAGVIAEQTEHLRAEIAAEVADRIHRGNAGRGPRTAQECRREGVAGLHGWQWMFILEAIPALIMTFAVLYYLTDRPMEAHWLEPQERQWLQTRLDRERTARERILDLSWFRAMMDWRVIVLGIVYMGCNIPQYGFSAEACRRAPKPPAQQDKQVSQSVCHKARSCVVGRHQSFHANAK